MIFKDIPKVDPRYKAGSDGKIYSFMKGEPLCLKTGKGGTSPYLFVGVLYLNGERKSLMVHKGICSAFNGEKPFDTAVCRHIDGDCYNNKPNNLAWASQRDNLRDKFIHGTHDSSTNNSRALIDKDELFVIRWLLENTDNTQKAIGDFLKRNRVFITKIHNKNRYGNTSVRVIEEVNVDLLDMHGDLNQEDTNER